MPSAHSCLVVLLTALTTAAGAAVEPWSPVAVKPGERAPIGLALHSVTVQGVVVRVVDGRTVAELELEARPDDDQPLTLAVVALDAARQPLAAARERVQMPWPSTPSARWTATIRLTLPLGDAALAAATQAVACGPVRPAIRQAGNLAARAKGARVVRSSTEYSEGYAGWMVLDDNPNTYWASATGQVQEQWLVVALPGEQPVTLNAIAINPKAEPGYPDCALKDWTLYLSHEGTADADFTEVAKGECEFADRLQRFEFPPTEARYLKLACHHNRGSDRWLELATFEAYGPKAPARPAPDLVQVVEDFEHAAPTMTTEVNEDVTRDVVMGFDVLLTRPTRPETAQTWRVDKVGCRSGSLQVERTRADHAVLSYGKLSYDFGNLLGGAPQSCGLVLDAELTGQPARLQFAAMADRPGNALRVVLGDATKRAWTFDLGRIDWRGWRTVSLAVDLARANVSGEGDGPPQPPLVLRQIAVAPKSRETLTGWVALDDVLALSAAR